MNKNIVIAYIGISLFLLTSRHVLSILQIDCVSRNLSRSDCIQYIAVYFQGFTGNSQVPIVPQGYSSANFPQNMKIAVYDPLQKSVCNVSSLFVSMAMQIKSVISVDALAGTITVDTWLNFIWNDDRLSWNETLTPIFSEEMKREGYNYIYIPANWIWTPDIELINSANQYSMPSSSVYLSPDGRVELVTRGPITASCQLNLKDFPFDKQTCSFRFGTILEDLPWGVDLYYLSTTEFPLLTHDFIESPAWQTVSVTVGKQEEILFGSQDDVFNKQPVVFYHYTMRRYSNHYYSTVILPDIVVCCVALASLWIDDYGARLGMAFTALLSIIAVLWSVSSNLPVTKQTTWMELFTNGCIVLVGLVCVESCTAGFMCKQSGPFPFSSLSSSSFSLFISSFFYSRGKPDRRKVALYHYDSESEHSRGDQNYCTNYAAANNNNNNDSDSVLGCGFDADPTWRKVDDDRDFEAGKETEMAAHVDNIDCDIFESLPKQQNTEKKTLSSSNISKSNANINDDINIKKWKAAAHAIDTAAKFVLPLLYAAILYTLFIRT